MTSKDPIKEKYDRVAPVYDRRWSGYVRLTLDYLAKTLPLRGDETVLDVPCGTGALMERLLEQHPDLKVTGIDLSDEMLRVAGEKTAAYPLVTLRQGRAEALPFDDDTFDVVVSASSFHYFDPPNEALREFRRVLRAGGRLFVMDWDRTHLLWRILDPIYQMVDPTYTRCYTPAEIEAILRQVGLEQVSVESVRLGWIWGLWIAQARIVDSNSANADPSFR